MVYAILFRYFFIIWCQSLPGHAERVAIAPAQPLFSFHSGVWINLHHFLYYQALLKNRASGRNARQLSVKDTFIFSGLDLAEKQHWEQAIDSIARKIDEICKHDHRYLSNPTLWHAILFYTTGEAVRRELGDYSPYAYKNGLWKRAWPLYIDALERDWQPYLDGRASFEIAITSLVRDVSTPR